MTGASRTAAELWRFSRVLRRAARRLGSRIQHSALGLPKSTVLNGPLEVLGPTDRLAIGSNVHIGEGFLVDTWGGVTIADNAHISRFVSVLSSQHMLEGSRLPYDERRVEAPVALGNAVWLGMSVIVLPGVSIGDGAVVGAGAIVSKDVPERAIVVGHDRLIGERDPAHFQRLMAAQSFGGVNGRAIPRV